MFKAFEQKIAIADRDKYQFFLLRSQFRPKSGISGTKFCIFETEFFDNIFNRTDKHLKKIGLNDLYTDGTDQTKMTP